MSIIMCILPESKYSKARNMVSSVANAPSRMRRNVGFKEEPGLSRVEKKSVGGVSGEDMF